MQIVTSRVSFCGPREFETTEVECCVQPMVFGTQVQVNYPVAVLANRLGHFR